MSTLLPIIRGHVNISGKGWGDGPVQQTGPGMVVDVRPSIDMRGDYLNQLAGVDQAAYLAFGIVEIPENAGFGRAGCHTGGFVSAFHTMHAEITLVGNVLSSIAVACVIGAGRDAVAAADAGFGVDDDDAVFTLVGGPNRACGHA